MANDQTLWQKIVAFVKWHPVAFNLLAIIFTFVILVWLIGVVFLGIWTNHGDTVTVPQVKGLQVEVASQILQREGYEVMLDSVYDVNSRRGMVVDQSPRENSRVKEGRTIYLRYVCYMPKKVAVPAYDMLSERAVKTSLQSLGITNIAVKYVPASNPNVLAIRYNGVLLKPGDMIPVGATIVLEVGQPYDETATVEEEYFFDGSDDYVHAEDEDERFIQRIENENR